MFHFVCLVDSWLVCLFLFDSVGKVSQNKWEKQMKDEKTHSFALPWHYYNSKTRVVTLEASSSYQPDGFPPRSINASKQQSHDECSCPWDVEKLCEESPKIVGKASWQRDGLKEIVLWELEHLHLLVVMQVIGIAKMEEQKDCRHQQQPYCQWDVS